MGGALNCHWPIGALNCSWPGGDMAGLQVGPASCDLRLRRAQWTPYQMRPPVVAKSSTPRRLAASAELTNAHARTRPVHLKIAREAWLVSRYGWLKRRSIRIQRPTTIPSLWRSFSARESLRKRRHARIAA